MHPQVTVIIVVHETGEHLQRTCTALASQTRLCDEVIVIDCSEYGDAHQYMDKLGRVRSLTLSKKLSYGSALAAAGQLFDAHRKEGQFLWFLGQDTAPDPDALMHLLQAFERSPSLGIAGPKMVDWDQPRIIRDFGQTMSKFGVSLSLVRNEYDQAQHDNLGDVLAVSTAGMLVKRQTWDTIEGFDQALSYIDDGLDLCVRARLAGFRVTVVPKARVAYAGDGVVGAKLSDKWSIRRKQSRQRRISYLHRRLSYASFFMLVIHWLALLPLALVRSVIRLIRKEPSEIPAELSAAFKVFFSWRSVAQSRRRRKRLQREDWRSLAPLRMSFSEMRRVRALKRDAALKYHERENESLDFFTTGGFWLLGVMSVVSLVLFYPLLSSGTFEGGGMLPLSNDVAQLWGSVGYGWRDLGYGFVGAVDPFAVVLAFLGTFTPWNPSLALVLVYMLAIPLAASGAWCVAARFQIRALSRILVGVFYGVAPTLLIALSEGRISAVIAHLLLPLLFLVGMRVKQSWSAAAATSLIGAVVVASAPILILVFLPAWVVMLGFAKKKFFHVFLLVIPTFILWLPLVVMQSQNKNLASLFSDPGKAQYTAEGNAWQFLFGVPTTVEGSWHDITQSWGIDWLLFAIIIACAVPLVVILQAGLFSKMSVAVATALGCAAVGLLVAFSAQRIGVAFVGSKTQLLWPGTGLSLYWLGVGIALALSVHAYKKMAAVFSVVLFVVIPLFVAPFALATHQKTSSVVASDGRTMPALIQANALTRPYIGTLVFDVTDEGEIIAEVIRGGNRTLEKQSIIARSHILMNQDEEELAVLTGKLVSQNQENIQDILDQRGIAFILLVPDFSENTSPDAARIRTRIQASLNSFPFFVSVGQTPRGNLWSYEEGLRSDQYIQFRQEHIQPWHAAVSVVQFLVLFIVVVLSIPMGKSVDRIEELLVVRWLISKSNVFQRRRSARSLNEMSDFEVSEQASKKDENILSQEEKQ